MATANQKQIIFKGAIVLFLLMIVLVGGCIQEKTMPEQLQTPTSPKITETTLPKTTMVFGNANKLNTAIGIPIKMGGDSSFQKIKIKGVDYYIIDPMIPELVSEFDYGYIYDDPGSVMPGFFNNFRFNTDDVALVEIWMSETGVTLSYTDFPVN